MKKTVLVTGSAGFIGANLVKELIKTTDYEIIGVDNLNDYYDVALKEYRLKEKGAILNWFDITEKDGYCSLNTKISEIMRSTKGRLVLMFFIMRKLKTMKKKSVKNSSDSASSMLKNKDTMKMIGSFTILRISSMAGTVGMTFTKEELLALNKKLNKVKLK